MPLLLLLLLLPLLWCARLGVGGCRQVWAVVWDEFSEFLQENRVPTSADFNTYPIRIFYFGFGSHFLKKFGKKSFPKLLYPLIFSQLCLKGNIIAEKERKKEQKSLISVTSRSESTTNHYPISRY